MLRVLWYALAGSPRMPSMATDWPYPNVSTKALFKHVQTIKDLSNNPFLLEKHAVYVSY